jgi:fatty-acid desaturase
VLLSDVHATQKRPLFFNRTFNSTDMSYVAFMVVTHGLALLAPLYFSWANVALFMGTYFITGCLGITLSFHRQLSHRSFSTPKWLEYVLAYCGVLSVQVRARAGQQPWAATPRERGSVQAGASDGRNQLRCTQGRSARAASCRSTSGRLAHLPALPPAAQGDPIEWVSSHRYHHLHTDTPLDPHSPYEGFWWSHMGWLLDNQVRARRLGRTAAAGMGGVTTSRVLCALLSRTQAAG